jgi:hypothetical protein
MVERLQERIIDRSRRNVLSSRSSGHGRVLQPSRRRELPIGDTLGYERVREVMHKREGAC